jgi:hypothetical protein
MRTEHAAAFLLALAGSAAGCREAPLPSIPSGRVARARADAERSLLALSPREARAGELFQAQPEGSAGLAVIGTGFTPDDEVCWGGRPLPTTFAHTRLLTATVPAEYLAEPGPVEVSVEAPADPSRRLTATFRLLPTSERP